jgi:hypothetical protein
MNNERAVLNEETILDVLILVKDDNNLLFVRISSTYDFMDLYSKI